jgi:hypothetical protein
MLTDAFEDDEEYAACCEPDPWCAFASAAYTTERSIHAAVVAAGLLRVNPVAEYAAAVTYNVGVLRALDAYVSAPSSRLVTCAAAVVRACAYTVAALAIATGKPDSALVAQVTVLINTFVYV